MNFELSDGSVFGIVISIIILIIWAIFMIVIPVATLYYAHGIAKKVGV